MSDEKYRAILERDPTDTQAFVALCNSAERNSDYQYLAQLYDFRAQVIKDVKEIADLYFKAGEIYVDKLDKLPEACEAFLKGFEADKTHAGIGDRLDVIYREAGDWESALQIAEQRLEALTVADANGTKTVIRSDLHQQTGEIWEKVYSDRKKALTHYKRAVELDKSNIMALYGAREIYYQAGKYKNAAKLCELEGRAEKDKDRRCALYRELAHLYETKLNDITKSIIALKRALKAIPKSQEVQSELARLISTTALTEENAKDHEWATEFLIRQAVELTGQPAIDLLTSAIISTPTSDRAIAFLESKADETGDFQALAKAYEIVIQKIPSNQAKQPALKQLVTLYQTRLNDPAAAARWSAALDGGALYEEDLTPAQPVDINRAVPPFSSAPPLPADTLPPGPLSVSASPGEHPDLDEDSEPPTIPGSLPPSNRSVPAPMTESIPELGESTAPETVESIPALEVPRGRVPVQDAGMSDEAYSEDLRLAADRARRGGDDATAELCLLQVLDMFPHDQKAITYLERRFRARSDWLSLRDLLLRSAGAPHLPQAVQTVRLREAARLSEEQIGDVTGAIEAWRVIKSNDPKVRDATDALVRLLGAAEQWDELLSILSQEAEKTKSRTKKLEAYKKMAEIYHLQTGNMEAAAAAYENLLEIKADDVAAMMALEDIYSRTERFEEAVLLLRKRADLSTDKAERRDLLFRTAMMLRDKLGRADDAYNIGKEILAFSKNDIEILTFMSALDEEAGQWSRLISLINNQIGMSEGAEKVEFIRKKADIALRKLEDRKMAVASLNELLVCSEDDLEAMDALIKIHSEAAEWEAFVDVTRKKLGAVAGRDEQLKLHKDLARVLESELFQEDEAMVSWRAVLEIEADTESLGALARFYERNEKWDDFAQVIEQQAAYAEDHKERADILFNRASIIREKLNDEELAVKELRRILNEVDPTHDLTMNLLIDVWVSKGNFEEAADLMDQRISYVVDKPKAKEMLLKLGEWAKMELGDLPRAMDAFERAVQLDKDDAEVLDSLDVVYTELGEWDKLLKLLYARAKASSDDEQKLELLSRGALICEEELLDKPKAWTWNVEMLDRLSHLEETVPTVEEAARRMELWKELIDLAAAMTRKAKTDDEQVGWWLKAADVFDEKISDASQALEAVLRAFGLTPDNEELLDRVDHLAVKVQNWNRLSTVYGVLVKRAKDNERRIFLLKRYASVLLDKGDRPSDAFDVIVKAFEMAPSDETLLERVEEIGEAAGRWDDMIRIYDGCANLVDELENKIAMKLKSVAVCRDQKDDPDGALLTLLDTLRIDPFDDDVVTRSVWEEIESLEADLVPTEAGSYWSKLIETYRILVEENKGLKEKQTSLIFKISEVYVEKLDDIAAAFEAMKENQELNPKDESMIDSLEALAAKNNYWSALVDHYQDILDETFEMEVAVMLHKRRARILEEELDQEDEAAEHYWQIIQLDSSATVAYDKLVVFYERAEKWNELVNLLERQLDNTREKEEKRPILLRIAGIWENDIGNKYEATDWYEQIRAKWPDDETANEALERLKKDVPKRSEDDELNEILSSMPPSFDDEDEDSSRIEEAFAGSGDDVQDGAESEAVESAVAIPREDGYVDEDGELEAGDKEEAFVEEEKEVFEPVESAFGEDEGESEVQDKDVTAPIETADAVETIAFNEDDDDVTEAPKSITMGDEDALETPASITLGEGNDRRSFEARGSITLGEDINDILTPTNEDVDDALLFPEDDDESDIASDDDDFEIEEEEELPPLADIANTKMPQLPGKNGDKDQISSAPPPPPPPVAVRRPPSVPVLGGVGLSGLPSNSDDDDDR